MALTDTLHPDRVGPGDWGHDCQSHLEDLCPPPPNSVSGCRLIKVLKIEEFVWETRPKSTMELRLSTAGCERGPDPSRNLEAAALSTETFMSEEKLLLNDMNAVRMTHSMVSPDP